VSINSIRLENFRGFDDASIDLKPLTVLLGPNSSGKSSFGHAVAAMAHSEWAYRNSRNASLTPAEGGDREWPIDLGLLRDLRRHGTSGSVYVSLNTSEGTIKWGFGLDDPQYSNRDLIWSYIEQPKASKASDRSGHIPTFISTAQPLAVSGALSAGIANPSPSLYVDIFKRLNENQWRTLPGGLPVELDTRGLTINSAALSERTGSVELNSVIRVEIRSFFSDLTYLRATRQRPARLYRTQAAALRQPIGYGGERTAQWLRDNGSEKYEIKLPPDISQSSETICSTVDVDWARQSCSLTAALNMWLHRIGLASSAESIPADGDPTASELRITLLDQRPHDITEVGFGISQIVPVIVAGIMQKPGSLLVVDLPEAHLHPKPQAALADFFCSLALLDKRCLIETHSDLFIHQLRLRSELTPTLRDRIAVYFLDAPKEGRCSKPRRMELGEGSELTWPAEFMQEGWEIEAQISAVREYRRATTK
jgi:hypothetical protein